MNQVQIVRVVVASPSDVKPERDSLNNVIASINNTIGDIYGLQLQLARWETDAYPGFRLKGPQELIDPILNIEDCDVLICIFWKRIGTPTTDAASGTLHELERAYRTWKETQRPEIMVYFSQKDHTPKTKEEIEQWTKVVDLRDHFFPEALWWSYDNELDFEKLVHQHLIHFIKQTWSPVQRSKAQPPAFPAASLDASSDQSLVRPGLEAAPASDPTLSPNLPPPSEPDTSTTPLEIEAPDRDVISTEDGEMTAMTNSEQLDPILDAVRQSFANQLERATNMMHATKECDELPIRLYYEVKGVALQRVKEQGRVQVVNILSHNEWEYDNFSNIYLIEETRQILVKKLVLERFFIGTVEQFENVNARGLMNKNRDARVVVRRVYINEKVSKNPAFERDIGFHETEPECLTEGIYEQGFLTHGRVSTNDARGEAAQIISVLEKYSPAYLARSDEQLRRYERSAKGWEEFYNARRNRTTVWKDDPSPILHAGEKLELLLSNILGEQDDLDRNSCIIVDAGCGDGINLKYCIEVCRKLSETFYNVRFDVTGVDFSPTAVDICKKNLEVESRPQFVDRRVVCRDILEEIPAVTDTVDLLFCANTFSHLHPGELNNALTEWRRVLRIGGRLLFNVYSTDDDTHLQCQEAARKRLAGCSRARQTNAWWYQDKYYKYYERDEIERIIRDAKFRVDAIRRMEWTDPAHDEYRPQPHVHRSWVVEATCTS